MASELRQKANEVLDLARKLYQDFSDQLTPAQRSAPSAFIPYSDWSAADVMGHITFWNGATLQRIEALGHGKPLPVFGPDDEVNAAAYGERKDWGWDRIWAEATDTLDKLSVFVTEVPDEKLGVFEDDKRDVWQRLEGNVMSHAVQHMADYWFYQKDESRAEGIHNALVAISERLGGDTSKGTALYNLACYHARVGHADKALPMLKDALVMRPDLIEWSRQDPDFESVRDNPAYLAIYATEAPKATA